MGPEKHLLSGEKAGGGFGRERGNERMNLNGGAGIMAEMDKDEIADLLDRMADLLEIAGENPFKLRAYRGGAERLRELSGERFDRLAENGRLTELEGIGEALSDKILQARREGIIDKFERTKRTYPVSLLDILRIHGLGPKSIRRMYEEMEIESLPDLETALELGKIQELKGFGPKTVENIEKSLERLERFSGRTLLMNAVPAGEQLLDDLREEADPGRIELAGSYRRGRETVGDLDILVSPADGEVGTALVEHPDVSDVLARGDTKTSVVLENGIQVDLREVEPDQYGAALLYFTGSKHHNVRLRGRARSRGWTINEYGLFDEESGEKLAGKTERSIYEALDLEWIPPELREDHGEVDAAANRALPDLVTPDDVLGDCHVHTDASDGRNSLREMIQGCREQGLEYVVITDHSRSLRVADGLSVDRLNRQVEQVRELDREFEDIDVLAGTEVDILADGELDFSTEVLQQLDWVIASVHSKFNLDAEAQTERITRAMAHPEVDVLGHPTGRQLGKRDPYEVRMEPVLKTAAREDVAVEINANGYRLDADDRWCRRGRTMGVKFVVSIWNAPGWVLRGWCRSA